MKKLLKLNHKLNKIIKLFKKFLLIRLIKFNKKILLILLINLIEKNQYKKILIK